MCAVVRGNLSAGALVFTNTVRSYFADAHWMNATAVFIDARPKIDFEAGHIEGALNLSLEMTADATQYAEVAAWLDPELPIILYCRGGLCSEAKDVGRLLKGAGYRNLLILTRASRAGGRPGTRSRRARGSR